MSEVKGERVACRREIARQKEQEMPRVWVPVQRRCWCWREAEGRGGVPEGRSDTKTVHQPCGNERVEPREKGQGGDKGSGILSMKVIMGTGD